MKARHDLHIHTTLSACCHDDSQVLPEILDRAKALGLTTIGITNHMWDSEVCICPNPWYHKQDFNHIISIRDNFPEDTKGIRVMIGCEAEFYRDTLGLSQQNKDKLDYALVPHSHIHMGHYIMPDTCVTDGQIGAFLCESFRKLVEHKMADSIAHPFYPCGYGDRLDGIMGSIEDRQLEELCCLARDCHTALEINTGMFPGKLKNGAGSEPMLRLFQIAKACGCRFTFGTDAHSLTELANIELIDPVTQLCGITENDLADWVRE